MKRLWYKLWYPRIIYEEMDHDLSFKNNRYVVYKEKKGYYIGIASHGTHPNNRWEWMMIINEKMEFQHIDPERLKRVI